MSGAGRSQPKTGGRFENIRLVVVGDKSGIYLLHPGAEVSRTNLAAKTGFLIIEYGFWYGNVFEESMNAACTSATVGDFVLTPFGDWNISSIVDLFATTMAG